jgi:hypothetical protein
MKTTTTTTALTLLSLLSAVPALAQQPASPPAAPPPPAAAPAPAAPDASPAAPAPTDVPPPPPLPAEAVPAAPPPTTEERVAELESKLEGLNESYLETKATASSLAKLKFSGYIQGRYAWQSDSVSGVDAMGRPSNFNRWLVRRGRLKATYTGDHAEYMLQTDATGTGVVLKDAEATFVDTWTPVGFRITVGQFKVPFGYEVLQSSGDREMPERARVIQALFPGERDRGLRVTARWEWLRFMGALVNGNFTQGDFYSATALDQNRSMNTYLRLGADLDFLVFNLSFEFGENLPTSVNPATLTITDTNMDGVIQANEIMRPAYTMRRFGIWRLGADAQFYFDIPGVGGMALKGELILSQDTNRDFRGVAADPCRDLKGVGWIVTGTQLIGDYLGIAARLDQWNPNRDVAAGTSTTCMTAATAAANDKITTLGVGPLVYISGNLKASAIYEHLWRSPTLDSQPTINPAQWVPNDQFTLQLQAKF